MGFSEELAAVLPGDLPHRNALILKASAHLEAIEQANRAFNLTRITGPREAAIKHVLDSVLPWRRFAEAELVLDAGSGAGFPGIPLAIVLPHIRFVLAESIGKKSRFLASMMTSLALDNVEVEGRRAETVLLHRKVDIITARAVVPLDRAVALFGPAVRSGSRALFYKGPDAEAEIAASAPLARARGVKLQILEQYDLPEASGARSIVEMRR